MTLPVFERLLHYQHGIAIAIEPILIPYSFGVCFHNKVSTCKCANEHKKCRTGQVEVGHHCIDDLEIIRRQYELVRPALLRLKLFPTRAVGNRLKRPDTGRPYCKDAPLPAPCLVYDLAAGSIDLEVLGFKRMVVRVIGPDR